MPTSASSLKAIRALTVPPSAVSAIGGQREWSTSCVIPACTSSTVSTGIRTGGYVEITSGLAGNEQVVNNFTPALVEGEEVRAQLMPRAESDYAATAD